MSWIHLALWILTIITSLGWCLIYKLSKTSSVFFPSLFLLSPHSQDNFLHILVGVWVRWWIYNCLTLTFVKSPSWQTLSFYSYSLVPKPIKITTYFHGCFCRLANGHTINVVWKATLIFCPYCFQDWAWRSLTILATL